MSQIPSRHPRLSRRQAIRAIAGIPVLLAGTARADPRALLPLDPALQQALAAFVDDARQALGVPGAAVVVVQRGDVIFLQGFGVREAGQEAALTPDTLLMIGSITKPLTALLAACLVETGSLTWETRIAELLPQFRTADQALTDRLTLDDLLTMSSGLPSRDPFLFWNAEVLTPDDIVTCFATTPAVSPVGQSFHYSNEAYAVAGYAIAAATAGRTTQSATAYRQAMQRLVLDPAGMVDSTFDPTAHDQGIVATPHSYDLQGANRPLPVTLDTRPFALIAPAAGLWSTARDLGALVRTVLMTAGGENCRGPVSAASLEQLWQPRLAVRDELAETNGTDYGRGWFIGQTDGGRTVGHGGSTVGFNANLTLLPEAGVGFAVLTNGAGGQFMADAVRSWLIDTLLGREGTAEADVARAAALTANRLAVLRSQVTSVDPDTVAPFLGRFSNPNLGTIVLTLESDKLIVDTGEFRSEARPLRTPIPDGLPLLLVDPAALGGVLRLTWRDGEAQIIAGSGEFLGGGTEEVFTPLAIPSRR